MSTQYKTPQFKKLQEKWYKKLKDEGFNDIEKGEDTLMVCNSTAFRKSRYPIESYNAKVRYFALAGQFLNDNKFETRKDKIVWELHTNGKSTREIETELKRRKILNPSRDMTNKIIRRLAKEMLKKYDLSDDL
jgi:hypothetical protein